jgi:opacity protein-like surface antigen
MKKLIATTLIAFALASPAMAFDISTIDGIPSDMKDMIAKQSGGRVTNKQAQQAGQQGQQQAGQDGQQQQQQRGRQSRKKLSAQDKAMQQAEQFMKGDSSLGQGVGSFR